ncbi:MAG: EamA family transporter [Actinomycetota bacterium]
MSLSKSFNKRPIAVRVGIALGLVYVIWGSTYLAIRVVVESIPALLSAGVRFLIAGAILYLFGIVKTPRSERPTRVQWGASAIVGGLLLLGGNGLVVLAEAHGVTSGLAALLIGAVPLWMGAIGFLFYREKITPVGIIGLVVGFAGLGILAKPSGNAPVAGTILMLIAALLWSIGSLYSRRAPLHKNVVLSTGMQMLCGGVLCVVAGIATGELSKFHPSSIKLSSALALIYLIFIGAIVGYTSYIYALAHGRTSLVSTYAYVNPVIAVILGALILNEHIGSRSILGGAIIVSSVAIILSSRPKTAEQTAISVRD